MKKQLYCCLFPAIIIAPLTGCGGNVKKDGGSGTLSIGSTDTKSILPHGTENILITSDDVCVDQTKESGWQAGNLIVVEAVKHAYSLEKRMWDNAAEFKTREQVYEHFRQGFSAEIAERLTNHSWSGQSLRPGDYATQEPDRVVVIDIQDSKATVYYETTSCFRDIWGVEKYSLDKLTREGAHWVITSSEGMKKIPTSPDNYT
jgi:hypothetical protein